MLLKNKTAVICGAAGSVGDAMARAVAKGGAHVFLTGRNPRRLKNLVEDITADGGVAEYATARAAAPG